MLKKNHMLLYFLFAATPMFAQITDTDDPDDDPYENASYFMYGINYLSNNVYLGRKDSLPVAYLTPYTGYHLRNGLYAKGTAALNNTQGNRLDLFTVEAGYDHTFGAIDAGAYVDKYFFNKGSRNARANIRASAGAYAQYTETWLQPQMAVDVNINKTTADYILNLQVEHDFALRRNTLHIIPVAAANLGTQHFYDDYFMSRLGEQNKKVKKAIADAGKFRPLDIEMSVKGSWRMRKWLFTATPTYAFPLNPAVVTLPNITVTEKLNPSFYVEFDICHR